MAKAGGGEQVVVSGASSISPRRKAQLIFRPPAMAVRSVLCAGLLGGATAYYTSTTPGTRRYRPSMWSGSAGLGGHDIYGFEEVALPPLPSGARLVIEEMKAESHDEASDDSEEGVMWRRIQRYVATQEDDDDDDAGDIGGEVWPAATAMCAWLANHTAEVHGRRVLELGCGTGACGLYAAALGASHVLLTDGGSAALHELCERNVEANALLFAPGACVGTAPLRWGQESDVLAAAAADGQGQGGSVGGRGGAFELILASDCSYGHESGCQHESLCQALRALLLVKYTDNGGSGGGARSPRAVLAHEHRARHSGLPWLHETLGHWDDGDEHLESFAAAARCPGQTERVDRKGRLREWG